MVTKNLKFILVALLLINQIILASAQSDTFIESDVILIEGEFVDLGDGYFLNVVSIDTFYENVRFSITRDGKVLQDFIYERGSTFYFEDENLIVSFDIDDTFSEDFINYVEISDVYYAGPTATGSILVLTNPPGADVYVDGFYEGTTGSVWMWIYDVQEGYHDIEFKKEGYHTVVDSVYVYADGSTSYHAQLEKIEFEPPIYENTGSIAILTTPSDVDVYLNGFYMGTTGTDQFWIYDVQQGYHNIELEKKGYYTVVDSVFVSPDETTYYSTNLEPIPIYDDGFDDGGQVDTIDALIGLLYLVFIVFVPILLVILLIKKRKSKKTGEGAGWKQIRPGPTFEEKPKKVTPPAKEKKVIPPPIKEKKAVMTPAKGKEPVKISTDLEYMGPVIRYKVDIKNQSAEPVSDIRTELTFPDKFILKEKQKTIPMLEPEKSKAVEFDMRPTGECRDCMVSGTVNYYDHRSKERVQKQLESIAANVACPSLIAEPIDEDFWRQKVSDMIIAEEYSKDLEIPVENLFDIVTRVLKDMNLYMIEPEITSTPQLYTGVARFYAVDGEGLQYAAYIEVVGKRRSRLMLKAWAEDAVSLTGFYHCMLAEIEKRTDIRIFVEEGVTQYTTISSTTIKDSLVQRSTIGGEERRCPKCGRVAKKGEKFCMECGERLE